MPEEWVSILGRAGRDGLECQALGKIRVEGLREEEDAIGASVKSNHHSDRDTSELGQAADVTEGTPTHAKV